MYGTPAMNCFKYQVYLYGLEAITYLSAILWVATEPALWVIWLPPPPTNFSMVKSPYLCKNQRENLYGWGTITCETTIPKPCV